MSDFRNHTVSDLEDTGDHFPMIYCNQKKKLTPHLQLGLRLRIRGAIPPNFHVSLCLSKGLIIFVI
jgi:hypothetical protein